jgi:hypothetical protein
MEEVTRKQQRRNEVKGALEMTKTVEQGAHVDLIMQHKTRSSVWK